MKGVNKLLEEPTDKPVDNNNKVSWITISMVLIGLYISLPGFVTGVKIGNAVGFYNSVVAFFSGGLVLGFIASCCALVGAKTQLSTYMLTQFAFGQKGAQLINFIFGLSLFGWFGVNTVLFGEAVFASLADNALAPKNLNLYTAIGGLLMVATAIFGFEALDKLSKLAVPLLCFALFMLVYMSIKKAGFEAIAQPRPQTMSLGSAISAVVGGSVVGAVIAPDTCRYARSYKDAIIAVVITFVIAKPIILLTSTIPTLATGLSDIMDILASLNLGALALGVVVFTTWTSNNSNLYSASLSLSSLFSQFKYWQLALISGVLGTILAMSGIMEHFIPFLHLLGITIPPVAGVYVVHFFVFSRGTYAKQTLSTAAPVCHFAMVSWVTACILGYCTLHGYLTITTVPAVDSLLTSASLYWCFKRYLRLGPSENNIEPEKVTDSSVS